MAHNVAIYMARVGFCPQYRPTSIAEQRVDMSIRNLFHNSNPNLTFYNPIGLAAGFDKNGEIIPAMILLGFGFIEIGTVTPFPQSGNPKPRMFRLKDDSAIINRYGFNSAGADNVLSNIQSFRNLQKHWQHKVVPDIQDGSKTTDTSLWLKLYQMLPSVKRQQSLIDHGVLGVNIGKNKSSESIEDTISDYVTNIRSFAPISDYIVINISSPNTPGLRDWQQRTGILKDLLTACINTRNEIALSNNNKYKTPLLIKVAPDLTKEQLIDIATVCTETGIDGIVISNTTNQRPADLISAHHIRNESGGLSGKPIKDKSTECIRILYEATDGGKIPIIGVGGISSGQDAYEKFKAGASLVQVYSCMIYNGPGVVNRIRNELAQILLDNGQRNLQKDVIGLDHEELFWMKRQQIDDDIQAKTPVVVIDTDDTLSSSTGSSGTSSSSSL